MLKELLLVRNEVGGIQLNWDGSEVFHLVIGTHRWSEYGCATATILNTTDWWPAVFDSAVA